MSRDRPSSTTTAAGTNGHSNIRVFVRWENHTVFAGEEVKCTITFKNVARTPAAVAAPAPLTRTSSSPRPAVRHASSERVRQYHTSQSRNGSRASTSIIAATNAANAGGLAPPPSSTRSRSSGHRSSLSLTIPATATTTAGPSRPMIDFSPSSPDPSHVSNSSVARPEEGRSRRSGHSHKRSMSTVSIASTSTAADAQSNVSSLKSHRPAKGHSRASSLHITARTQSMNGPSRPFHDALSSPLASLSPLKSSVNGYPSGAMTMPNTPGLAASRLLSKAGSDVLAEFKFPMRPALPTAEATRNARQSTEDLLMSLGTRTGDVASIAASNTRPRDCNIPTINEHGVVPPPATRILSTTSIAGGTPRSSGEFYSLSNNSSETLASDYVTQQPLRIQGCSAHPRRPSNLSSFVSPRSPEALMMGYAQVQGTFTLDGSLVNLGPFEQVKRKAVLGGQGGGVIGIETAKREGGLLGSFGWGSITNSIGELLGGGELSSIKEMRGLASSKSIPLLSTPQSILFVNLQLGPGETKSFDYSFRLPRGLPPTHRGKAIKISYSLVIGTQRPGGAKEQQVKSVDVPFRVLGGVNSHGEILGHDLMSPYIILRDPAQVKGDSGHNRRHGTPHSRGSNDPKQQQSSNLNSFLSFVDNLLVHSKDGANMLSTPIPTSRRPSTISLTDDDYFPGAGTAATPASSRSPPPPEGEWTHRHGSSVKDTIDLAILRSNAAGAGGSGQSANRFEIARNGRRVGVVMLARPAYRLGETVTAAVDFSGAEVPCYAVHAALETAERVDPTLALRSEASVHRVTRRVIAAHSEASLYARRVVFTPTIPVSATPEFMTTGVSLDWKIRIEFVVAAGVAPTTLPPTHNGSCEPEEGGGRDGGPETRARGGLAEGDDDDDDDDDGTGKREDQGLMDQRPGKGPGASNPLGLLKGIHPLLEELSRDDRAGLVLVAAENLPCESFEVAVPLRVYGSVCAGLERLEREEALEEGLAV